MSDAKTREIGNIGNYYGGLEVKENDGEYSWGIENWDGIHYDRIPEYLYNALMKYQDELENPLLTIEC